jgi:Ca2+-binding EF-hand superfamily protein
MTPKLHHSLTPLLFLCLLGASVVQAQAQTPGEAAFQRLDKNKDNQITRDESPGPDGFAAADADKSGAVTPEEFRRYLASRQRPQTPNPAPAPTAETAATSAPA